MMDFETEEQQLEALKKWWKENGVSIIFGLVLGTSSIVGWKLYGAYEVGRAQAASDSYNNFMSAAETNSASDEDILTASNIVTEYSDTPYASLTSFVLAKLRQQAGEHESAIGNLDWVIENSADEELRLIARARKSRILIELKEYDKALSLLGEAYPPEFAAVFEELKGDIYSAQGMIELARASYDKAEQAPGVKASKLLLMKRNDLGES